MGGGERMVKRHPTEEHEGRGSVSAVVKVGTRDQALGADPRKARGDLQQQLVLFVSATASAAGV